MWEVLKILGWVIAFLIMLLFIGCSSKQIEYIKVNDSKIQLYAGEIQQLNQQKYKVELFDINSMEYTCLKTNDYSIIVKNYQELKAYSMQQKDIIEFYEKQINNNSSPQ